MLHTTYTFLFLEKPCSVFELYRLALKTDHASSRSIPKPPDPWSSGGQSERHVTEAGDRREWICIPLVSILALFRFPLGNV